jgi:dehydrogenase/reductase SDR family protein 12
MGQTLTTTQFYLYGRSHFTATGYQNHVRGYPQYVHQPDILQSCDLSEKVFLVTGANNGVGKEITQWLYNKGATVCMVCRSEERALEAQKEIMSKSSSQPAAEHRLPIVVADCAREGDVRSAWKTFETKSNRLDGLICNAGALLNARTLTPEGLETTFSAHLLFGSYLLGKLAMPMLESTPDSRLIMVSSGGMYNHNFPDWDTATSAPSKAAKYDGQLAYVYAKRGQVLLAERWGLEHPKVKTVTCHPGWTLTPGVEAAYGKSKSALEPLRSLWEGAEGICWLAAAPASQIKSGEFYLDRQPQTKHMAGLFGTEGWATKNSAQEVDAMMKGLELWSSESTRPKL